MRQVAFPLLIAAALAAQDTRTRPIPVATPPLRFRLDLASPGQPLLVDGEGPFYGLTSGNEHVVARGERMFGYHAGDGVREFDLPLPGANASIASFGLLIAVWQPGSLSLVDPETTHVRTRALPDLPGQGQLATVGERLLLVQGRTVHRFTANDVQQVGGELPIEPRFVCGDDRWLWIGDARTLRAFALTTDESPALRPAPVGPRSWPTDIDVLAGCWSNNRLLVAHRAETNGAPSIGLTCVEGIWDPRPKAGLALAIRVVNGIARYEFEGRPLNLAQLTTALQQRGADPASLVTWPRGERRLPQLTIAISGRLTFHDLEPVTRAARDAGFLDIDFAPREDETSKK
jgi:hypothetical protein